MESKINPHVAKLGGFLLLSNDYRPIRVFSGSARQDVFNRDKGLCANCGMDCIEFENELKLFNNNDIKDIIYEHFGKSSYKRKTFWDADHIKPIGDGGSICDLDNYQTLCICCHREKTIMEHKNRKK